MILELKKIIPPKQTLIVTLKSRRTPLTVPAVAMTSTADATGAPPVNRSPSIPQQLLAKRQASVGKGSKRPAQAVRLAGTINPHESQADVFQTELDSDDDVPKPQTKVQTETIDQQASRKKIKTEEAVEVPHEVPDTTAALPTTAVELTDALERSKVRQRAKLQLELEDLKMDRQEIKLKQRLIELEERE